MAFKFFFSYRICSPQVIRIPREEDYKYIQKQILRSLGPAVHDDVIYRADVSGFEIFYIKQHFLVYQQQKA